MAKGISFRCSLVTSMPYLLLKFLIKEDCLHKFVEACLHTSSPATLYEIWDVAVTHKEWVYKKRLLKRCMNKVIPFNNYWYRKFWAFEEFLERYEKAHSK